MSDAPPGGSTALEAPAAVPPDSRSRLASRSEELKWCGGLFAALALLGVALGVLWDLLSPTQSFGVVLSAGIEAGESQAAIEAEGRYAVIVLIVGLMAGVVAWSLRRARGVLLGVALAAGTLLNSYLIVVVGRAVRGTEALQHRNGLTFYAHVPLGVHMTALYLIESAVALLVYGSCVAFAARDDLGRPDPVTDGRSRAEPLPD